MTTCLDKKTPVSNSLIIKYLPVSSTHHQHTINTAQHHMRVVPCLGTVVIVLMY